MYKDINFTECDAIKYSDVKCQECRKKYCELIKTIDYFIGKIIIALKEIDIWKDTVSNIFFK